MTRLIPVIAGALILSVSLPAGAFADQTQTQTQPQTRSLSLDDRHRYDGPAAKGDARAQTALGLRFAGHKTQEGDTTAFGWFKRAAEQGDAEAQLLLSGLLATGRGVEKDYVAAYKWAYLSGLRATEPEIIVNASNMIGVLNRQMSDDEIDSARQQAVGWTPKLEIVQNAATGPSVFHAAAVPAPVKTEASAQPAAPASAAAEAPKPVAPVAVAETPASGAFDAVAKAEPQAIAKAEPQAIAKVEPQAGVAVPAKSVSNKSVSNKPVSSRSVSNKQAERRNAQRTAAKAKPRTRSARNADYDQLVGTALSYARAYGIHLGGWQY